MSKSYKSYVTVQDSQARLSFQQVDNNSLYDRSFAALSDLSTQDIDELIVFLQDQKQLVQKVQAVL
jgi:non-ribosomal peptide synthetase component E (peptide arylation enzyme)